MAIRRVGVVGCGLMGGGIAQTCAQSGYEVVVREVNERGKLPSFIYFSYNNFISRLRTGLRNTSTHQATTNDTDSSYSHRLLLLLDEIMYFRGRSTINSKCNCIVI